MTKREWLERKRRRRRIRRIRMAIKITVYSLFALLVFGVVWAVGKPLVNMITSDEDGTAQQLVSEADDEQIADETKDPIIPGTSDNQIDDAVTPENEGDLQQSGDENVQQEDADAQTDDDKSGVYEADANQTGWKVDDAGWSYVKEDGTSYTSEWQNIDGIDYYFTENGYMATGWVEIGENSHYFRTDGSEDKEAHQKLVAITYDDGPSTHTNRLLDILDQYDVPATFFVVGTQCETYPDILKREADMGMEIGSHTYDHTYLHKVSAEEIDTAMSKNEDVLKSIIGRGSEIMRPTGGGINDTVRERIGMPMICWDVDTLDWKSKDAGSVAQIIREQVQDGSIILMHDLYESTVDASEVVIPELLAQGYKFVTISELAQRRGVVLQDGQDYYDFYPQNTTENTEGSAQ